MHNITKIKTFRAALWITFPISYLLLYPVALLKKKRRLTLFFFFDRYCIGGAQRVHLDILKSIADVSKEVYFTRYSQDNFFQKEFYSIPNTYCKDIHHHCDYFLFRLFSVHYYAFYINNYVTATVFSSNSTFFYDMLPFLNKSVVKTELLHNFSFNKNGMEFFGLLNAKYLNQRVVVDAVTGQNIIRQYIRYKIKNLENKVLVIEPGVEIPAPPQKQFELPLKILYAGRGGPQKRINLLNKICEQCLAEQLPVSFHFAGPAIEELSETVKSAATLHGQISEPAEMYKLYAFSHIILMTSAYEGFPMFIKEGMANGCVPVVTALEGNKMHLTSAENALLIEAVEDEQQVVAIGVEQIKKLVTNLPLLRQLSDNAYYYAVKNFSREKFNQAYRQLLLKAGD